MVLNNLKQVYSEVDEFLELLTVEQRNEIPQKLRNFFKEEKDKYYNKGINPQIPIKKQDLKEETLAIIALLNLEYWCKDEVEKERLKRVYLKNDEVYKEILQIEFDSETIFNKKSSIVESEQDYTLNTQIVEYKESKLKRILKKFFKFFS